MMQITLATINSDPDELQEKKKKKKKKKTSMKMIETISYCGHYCGYLTMQKNRLLICEPVNFNCCKLFAIKYVQL
jgi:hypothetical protein